MVPLHCQPVDVQIAVLAIPEAIEEVMRTTLTLRECIVLRAYYGLDDEPPMLLKDIGKQLSLTRERVRQIKEKAIRRLRHKSRSERLRPIADLLFSFCAGDEI